MARCDRVVCHLGSPATDLRVRSDPQKPHGSCRGHLRAVVCGLSGREEHAVTRSPPCNILWTFSITQEGLQHGSASVTLFLTAAPGLCDQGNIACKDWRDTSPGSEVHLAKEQVGTLRGKSTPGKQLRAPGPLRAPDLRRN